MAEQRRPHLIQIDRVLETVMRGEPVALDTVLACDAEAFCRAAEDHGVLPVVADRLAGRSDLPAAWRARLKETADKHVATDLIRETEMRRLLAALDEARVGALLMKGTALAYTHYRRPDLRPRVDTDLFIPATGRPAVDRALTHLGYSAVHHVGGDLLMYQAAYVRVRNGVRLNAVDVHWKIANPQVFADWLSYDELAAAAVPVPGLHAAARALSNVHSLLVACVHRVAHHFDSDRLVWFYDIHLVASRLTGAEWRQFADVAVERRVAAVCRQSLARTAQTFGTVVPVDVTSRLESGMRSTSEATAAYLVQHPRRVRVVASDLWALPTWAARWRLLREHLLPPARYMREVYAPSSGAPLPLLYARRALRGARKYLTRS